MESEAPKTYIVRGTDQYGNPIEELIVDDESSILFAEALAFGLGRRDSPPEGIKGYRKDGVSVAILPKNLLS